MKMKRLDLFLMISLCLLTLFSISSVQSLRWCEQPLPNSTNTTNCGNLTLVAPVGNFTPYWNGTDYDTAVYDITSLTFNYTKPVDAINATWQVKHGNLTTYNITLPFSCWNASTTKLRLRVFSYFHPCSNNYNNYPQSHPECWNGTEWISIGNESHDDVWQTNTYPFPAKLNGAVDGDWNTASCYVNSAGCDSAHWWTDSCDKTHNKVYGQSLFWQFDNPEYYDGSTNPSSPQNYSSNRTYNFDMKWRDTNDTFGYNYSFIEHNFTGIMRNYSTFNNINDTPENVTGYNYTLGYGWQSEGEFNQTWDKDFNTIGQCDLSYPADVFCEAEENYTIVPNNPANWTTKWDDWGGTSYFFQRCWNYTSNSWSVWYVGNETIHVFKNVFLPADCLKNSPLIIHTWLKSSGGSRTGYFEGRVDPRIDNSTYYNFTGIPAGVFAFRFIVNNSRGYWNATPYSIYIVNKTQPTLNLTNNISWLGVYQVASNTSGNCFDGIVCNLYRNHASVSNPDIFSPPNFGLYNYTFNTTGNQNISSGSTSQLLTILLRPQWYNNKTSVLSPQSYDALRVYGFEVKWWDDKDTNGYNFSIIEHDFNGTLLNYTTIRSGNISYYNYTGIKNGTRHFKFYGNDSDGLWNSTTQWSYLVTICGDGTCQGSESPSNCCKDCGCSLGQTCYDNECMSKTRADFKDIGAGFGSLILNMSGATTIFIIVLAVALMGGAIIYSLGKRTGGSSSESM